MDLTGEALLLKGRDALRRGDAEAARAAYESARGSAPEGQILEGLARAAFVAREFDDCIDLWEQAYAAYRAASDGASSVRVARTLGCMHGSVRGDWAVGSGWVARAQRLMEAVPGSPEAGWISLTLGMFEPNRALKEQHFAAAAEVASTVGDTDLMFAAMAYSGASLVHGDRVEEGMVLLDEALAATAGGEIDDLIVIEEIFCQLFSACEKAQDIARAEQWMRAGESLAARRNLPAVSAYCHTHFGGVMTAAGRWGEAEAALTEAVRLWALGQRTLRAAALARLADLRVRQGRFEEAAVLLGELDPSDETAIPMARLLLERGEPDLARDVLEQVLSTADPAGTACIPFLALLVDVHVAAGRLDDAAGVLRSLEACADDSAVPHLRGMVELARGRVAQATGTGDPMASLRAAVDCFLRAELPLEAALSRLALATACATDRPDVALAEARSALDRFERLRAARHVDAASALLRTLGVKVAAPRGEGGTGLTAREQEVLDLLGHGLSNPEIASRLFISRKTVEHHVGNVLAKLGLRSRSEAAAYAVRMEQATGQG
jgi:DNA-binding CsgD family transcriptional regulator